MLFASHWKRTKCVKKKYVAEHCGCGDMQQQKGMEGKEGGGEVMAEEERGGWGVAGWQGRRWGAVAGWKTSMAGAGWGITGYTRRSVGTRSLQNTEGSSLSDAFI